MKESERRKKERAVEGEQEWKRKIAENKRGRKKGTGEQEKKGRGKRGGKKERRAKGTRGREED